MNVLFALYCLSVLLFVRSVLLAQRGSAKARARRDARRRSTGAQGLALLVLSAATLSCRALSCGSGSHGDGPSARPPAHPEPIPSRLEETMVCPAALLEARQGGSTPNRFVAPSEDERTEMKGLFTRLLAARDVAALDAIRADAAKIGFEIVEPPELAGTAILREVGSKRHGGGAYVVRLGSTSRLIVQAPHTFYDEGTLPIACAYFARSQARALFINTVHRYKGAPEDARGQYPADVAHAPATHFQAATEATAAACAPVTVVQLHGFATREPRARAVVSTGEKRHKGPIVERVSKALAGAAGAPILRYPDDTSELGATTNVQGTVVRAAGGRFVHIEMDEGLRKDLQTDGALAARFFAALNAELDEK